MDIQFILDEYACCSYIVNYINKSHREISRILRETVDEIRGGNVSIKQKLQHIGHRFISGTEILAQEVVVWECVSKKVVMQMYILIHVNPKKEF